MNEQQTNSLIGWLKSYARLPAQIGLPGVKLNLAAELIKEQAATIKELRAEIEAERAACAQLCRESDRYRGEYFAQKILARGDSNVEG